MLRNLKNTLLLLLPLAAMSTAAHAAELREQLTKETAADLVATAQTASQRLPATNELRGIRSVRARLAALRAREVVAELANVDPGDLGTISELTEEVELAFRSLEKEVTAQAPSCSEQCGRESKDRLTGCGKKFFCKLGSHILAVVCLTDCLI